MSRTYDIVIIGSGIAGSISAAILAKHGLKTLILDAGQHPRFSIGEAMPRAACSCASSRNASGSPNWPSSPILSRSSGTSDRQPAGSSWHSASPGTLPAWTALPSMSSPLRWTLRRPTCIARTSTSTPCCSRSSTARTPATTRASKDSSSFPRCGHPSRRRRKPASSLCHRPGLYVGIQCNCLKFHLSGTPEQEFSGCWIYPSSPSTSQRPLQCRIRHMGYSSTVIAAPLAHASAEKLS